MDQRKQLRRPDLSGGLPRCSYLFLQSFNALMKREKSFYGVFILIQTAPNHQRPWRPKGVLLTLGNVDDLDMIVLLEKNFLAKLFGVCRKTSNKLF